MATPALLAIWKDLIYEEYQKAGIYWLMNQPSGGILADEMGLGKTIQLLGVLVNSPVLKTLLIGPLAVLGQWKTAALRSGLKVFEFVKGSWESEGKGNAMYLINYEKLKSIPTSYRNWDYIICDEAHKLRNRGKSYDILLKFMCKKIYFLTGTPVVNRETDMLAYFILMKIIPNSQTTFCIRDEHLLSKYMLARKRAVIDSKKEADYKKSANVIAKMLSFLPTKAVNLITDMAGIRRITSEVIVKVLEFSSDEESEFYQGVQGTIVRRWKAFESDNSVGMLVLLMRLRQLSIHPQVYITSKRIRCPSYERDDWATPSTKFEESLELILSETPDHNWIIFCNFKEEIILLKEFFEEEGFVGKIHMYHGSMNRQQREDAIEATKEVGVQHLFLVQIQAGGTGLNLQHFSRAIFLSPCWTSAIMDQAAGRLLRMGQLKHVKLYHLLLEGEVGINIDKKMRESVDRKKGLLDYYLAQADCRM